MRPEKQVSQPMKTSVMREFVRLAENRNFSRTAEELYITQPALSRHISALEEELGAKLIDRSRNSFELTPSGQIALEGFREILGRYEQMLGSIARQNELERGELHLGFLYYDRDFYVARIRDMFREKYPEVGLVLHSYQPREMEEALMDGKIDVAICYGTSECLRNDITVLPFLELPYSIMFHKKHRFSGMDEINPEDLTVEKLIVSERDFELSHGEGKLRQMLDENGIEFSQTIPISNFDEVPWVMEETGGVYITPIVNNQAYGKDIDCRPMFPDRYRCDLDAVCLSRNENPAIPLLFTAIKMCYPG